MEFKNDFVVAHLNSQEFHEKALETFRYQYQRNPVYQDFCDYLKKSPAHVPLLVNMTSGFEFPATTFLDLKNCMGRKGISFS